MIGLTQPRLAGSIILLLTHGYTIKPEGTDYLIQLADDLMTEFALATTPGLWLVDTIPMCESKPYDTLKFIFTLSQ